MRRIRVVVALLMLAGRAEAEVHPDSKIASTDRRNAVYGILGLGTPVGFAGIEAARHLGSYAELAVGLGAGSSAWHTQWSPLQWSVMPRLRLGQAHLAFIAGVGVSGGNMGPPFNAFCGENCPTYPDYPGYWTWLNFEAGGEHWLGPFALRYFVGFASGCRVAACSGNSEGLPYAGMGFGYAF
jgi:hypothetical protein